MPAGQHEPVPAEPLRVGRVMPQHIAGRAGRRRAPGSSPCPGARSPPSARRPWPGRGPGRRRACRRRSTPAADQVRCCLRSLQWLLTAGSGLLSWPRAGPPLGQANETLPQFDTPGPPGVPGRRSRPCSGPPAQRRACRGSQYAPAMATPMPGFDPRAVIEGRPGQAAGRADHRDRRRHRLRDRRAGHRRAAVRGRRRAQRRARSSSRCRSPCSRCRFWSARAAAGPAGARAAGQPGPRLRLGRRGRGPARAGHQHRRPGLRHPAGARRSTGEYVSATFGAPVVEETLKGSPDHLLWRRRQELDGPTDGIIYAAMVGLGFAMIENVGYYIRRAGPPRGGRGQAARRHVRAARCAVPAGASRSSPP